jgi:hypothetical protein
MTEALFLRKADPREKRQMVETRGPLRSFVSVGFRLCRISSTMIVPPIQVEHSINAFEGSTNAFVKIKGMSAQVFIYHLKVTPKTVSLAAPMGNLHEIAVEVRGEAYAQPIRPRLFRHSLLSLQ